MFKGILIVILIYSLFRLMGFVDGVNLELRKYNLNFWLYRWYVVSTTIIHELSHYILAKLFAFKVSKFKVVASKELKEKIDIQNFGEVEFTPENKEGNTGFSEMIGKTITGLAPFILAFIVFTMIVGVDIISNTNYGIYSFSLIFKSPLLLFGLLGFGKSLFLIVLFTGLLTATSTLSKEDIDIAFNTENILANIYLVIYLVLVLIINFLVSITTGNIIQQTPISLVILIFLSLIGIGLFLGLLSLYKLRTVFLVLSAIPLAFMFTGLLNIFILFMVFYLLMLVVNVILSILFIKFVGSSTNFDIDNSEQDYQDNFENEEEW
ncbi:hypothetical protein [Vagococcus lutrae]|uniref:hypothetical protein n=1 Tax=Vagococcus lutrae TaxID=81947 RepID=UPI0028918915|nr:hypothetical protein [Vagococcus lutrae]MDT2844780.1 hypothetical protein [Vagococcus lutrae]